MADLKLTDDWVTGIYQLEEADLVLGGPDGIDNRQAKELGARTNYLRKHGIAQWAATIAYDVDCYVKHSGSLWRSKRVCLDKEPGKSADDWEVLTMPLSQLDARYHAKDGQLAWGKVTGTPTTLAGYGIKDQPWAQPIANLSNAVAAKAENARVDQSIVGVNQRINAEVAKLLPTATAAATYLAKTDAAASFNHIEVLARAHGSQLFTQNGVFIVPEGVTEIYITGCGGGAGGGGAAWSDQVHAGGGGGGSGHWVIRKRFSVKPGQRLTIVIGGAGVGAIASQGGKNGVNGTDGGATTIAELGLTLPGGIGGGGANILTIWGNGGTSGQGGPGGQCGSIGAAGTNANFVCPGGNGGTTPFGGGGVTSAWGWGASGQSGDGYGSGGSGGQSSSGGPIAGTLATSGGAGGSGAPGIIDIQW